MAGTYTRVAAQNHRQRRLDGSPRYLSIGFEVSALRRGKLLFRACLQLLLSNIMKRHIMTASRAPYVAGARPAGALLSQPPQNDFPRRSSGAARPVSGAHVEYEQLKLHACQRVERCASGERSRADPLGLPWCYLVSTLACAHTCRGASKAAATHCW